MRSTRACPIGSSPSWCRRRRTQRNRGRHSSRHPPRDEREAAARAHGPGGRRQRRPRRPARGIPPEPGRGTPLERIQIRAAVGGERAAGPCEEGRCVVDPQVRCDGIESRTCSGRRSCPRPSAGRRASPRQRGRRRRRARTRFPGWPPVCSAIGQWRSRIRRMRPCLPPRPVDLVRSRIGEDGARLGGSRKVVLRRPGIGGDAVPPEITIIPSPQRVHVRPVEREGAAGTDRGRRQGHRTPGIRRDAVPGKSPGSRLPGARR